MFSSHKYVKSTILGISLLMPHFAFAAITNFASFVGLVIKILSLLIPIVISLALLAFLWGITVFILNAGDAQKRSEGKQIMIWGIIALFVMLSVWGLVRLLQSTFQLQSSVAPPVPQIPGSTSGSGPGFFGGLFP